MKSEMVMSLKSVLGSELQIVFFLLFESICNIRNLSSRFFSSRLHIVTEIVQIIRSGVSGRLTEFRHFFISLEDHQRVGATSMN